MMHFYQTFESGPFSLLQHLSPTLADAGIAGQPVRSNFQVDALVISKGLRLSETIATDGFFLGHLQQMVHILLLVLDG